MCRTNVGIITFHRADNLGAVLQAYALQKVVESKIVLSSEIIDYRCQAVEDTKRTRSCMTFKDRIKYLPMKLYYFIKHSGFERFRKENLKLSKTDYTCDNIKECVNDYDVFITGSDQVWNLDCSGDDMTYFLDFVPSEKKKFSYAASIGEYKYNSNEAENVYKALADFSGVSVREESAAEQLGGIGVKGVEVLPDPVVLLSRSEWEGVMCDRLCREKYILVYLISEDVNVCRSAHAYAKEHNFKIINNKKSIEFILHNSPAEFLSWVCNAECVFTNSFHGTAFSLIFNKPLCADVELKNGGTNSRVVELLVAAKAEHCVLDKESLTANTPNAQDYLEKSKKAALEYLKNNC